MKKLGLITAAAVSFMLAGAPLTAQETSSTLPVQPTKGDDQTPGLQQTPEGQTMKTAGEKTRPILETQAGPVTGGGGSTGPTFPNNPPPK